jgi:GntR family transcriptional regulator
MVERPMLLHIDYSDKEPICQQAADQIKLLVVSGRLKAGDRLPSIRQLAKDARINPTTVSRIYGQLAHEGVVTLRQGQGVFVSEGLPPLAAKEVRRIVGKHARGLLVEGLRHGLSIRQIRQAFEEEYDSLKGSGQ